MHKTFWPENLKGRETTGRTGRRWEDNTETGLKDLECDGVDWIHLAQDRDVRALLNTIMNLRFPHNVGKTRLTTISFSRKILPHGVKSRSGFSCRCGFN
jgi:hypothetical protein